MQAVTRPQPEALEARQRRRRELSLLRPVVANVSPFEIPVGTRLHDSTRQAAAQHMANTSEFEARCNALISRCL